MRALACVASLMALCAAARAEPPETLPVFPTPGQVRAHQLARAAGALRETLEQLPGVQSARVHLAFPDRTLRPLDSPGQPATASASLVTTAQFALAPAAVQALVAAGVQGLDPAGVTVTVTRALPAPTRAEPRLTHVGPFTVEKASAPALRWVLIGALALNAVLALTVIGMLRRARRVEARPR